MKTLRFLLLLGPLAVLWVIGLGANTVGHVADRVEDFAQRWFTELKEAL